MLFVTLIEVEIRLHSLQTAFLLPNSLWSGAQADTISPFETASFFYKFFQSKTLSANRHFSWIKP